MDKTDRELLELAAKAAGIEYRPECGYRVTGIGATGMPMLESWNPLTDDGDTLRLEVALKDQIKVYWSTIWKKWVAETNERIIRDDDRKRCSVRAAAAIGSAMGEKL